MVDRHTQLIRRILRYLLALLAGMLLVGGPVAPTPDPTPTPDPVDPFLRRQAAALRPEFRDDLRGLTDVPRYTIEATVSPERGTVDGTLRVRYVNRSSTRLDRLVFRLLPNAPAIYGGGRLDVRAVTRNGSPVATSVSHAGTALSVPLRPRLAPNGVAFVQIDFTATVPAQTTQGYGIFNQALGVTMLAGWYPVLTAYDDGWLVPDIPTVGDAMLTDISLYEVTLNVPAGTTVVATGVETKVAEEGDVATWHLISGPAREFAVALSERFEPHQTTVDGTTITAYMLPAGERQPATAAAQARDILADAFRVYSNRFGPYPLTEFDLVETFITIDGYEFAGMAAGDLQTRIDAPAGDYQFLLAHETAHQWWYNVAGNNPIGEPWLDESLATYATLFYFQDVQGAAVAEATRLRWLQENGVSDGTLPPIWSSTHAFSEWKAYNTVTYYHGAFFWEKLRDRIGDDRFSALLARYYESHRYARATTADVVDLVAREPALTRSDVQQWLGLDRSRAPDQ